MSQFLIVAFDRVSEEAALLRRVEAVVSAHRLALFYPPSYLEPFLSEWPCENKTIISLADNGSADNCEMLLLPEHCRLGDKCNPLPFHKRMEILQSIFGTILEYTNKVDIFIGTSGLLLDAFTHYHGCLSDFLPMEKELNTISHKDIRFTVVG